jgi:predicted RNase H-like HicB family nuclease
MSHDERRYNVWVVIRPAPDLPGQWVAHCLDIDVMSQGDSIHHALLMAYEATNIVALDELNKGRDPLARRAPPEFFGELYGLFERGEKLSPESLQKAEVEGRIVVFATQLELRFEGRAAGEEEAAPRSMRSTQLSIAQQTC